MMTTIQQAAQAIHEAAKEAGAIYTDIRKNLDAWDDRFCADMGIVVHHEFPPIPDYRFDWCAYYDGTEETGNYGWDKSASDAIADLIKNYERPS